MKTKKNFLCDHKKVLKSESIFSFQFKDLSNSESKIKENKLVPVSRRPPQRDFSEVMAFLINKPE